MTRIANPIYDVVFKYLLSDNKVAKLLLSDLLGVDIISLELRPQEFSTDNEQKTITVYRLDFKAEIVLKSGEKLVVLIEIQKAKFTTDLIRFRKYLGEQYASKQNITEQNEQIVPLPIVTVYFLGYGLNNNKDIPIIRVKRQYLDNYNGEQLQGNEAFIESLTHDSIIVQIPALKHKHRDDLEKALSVFDSEQGQELSVNESDYPERYKSVIRQLVRAISDEQVRKTMDVEDELLEHLQKKERVIAKKDKLIEEQEQEIKAKVQALEETYKVIEKKDKILSEKEDLIIKLQSELNKLKNK